VRPLCFSPPRGRPRVRVYASGVMVGVFFMLSEKEGEKSRGEKVLFFPCLVRPGEEEDLQCRSERHRFRVFFKKMNSG